MKKILLTTCLLLGNALHLMAQQEPLIDPQEGKTLLERLAPDGKAIATSSMNLQFYTSLGATYTDGTFDEAAFKLNKVRLEFLGKVGKNLSYHFRQSFNKGSNPRSLDNLSSSVEYAYMGWHMDDRLTLTVGKQILQLSGHEYWLNGIKIREFSDFVNTIPCFQAGINAAIHLSANQTLNLQVANNRSGEDDEVFAYGRPAGVEESRAPMLGVANYDGNFCDGALQLRYSVAGGNLAKGRDIFYFTCANVWERGPLLLYLDLMYSREGVDSKGLVSELSAYRPEGGVTAQYVDYATLIANMDYRVHPKWNLYVKGAYETGNVYKANGPYEKGAYRRTWNVQACAEFFPMKNSELLIFLHLLHKHYGMTSRAKTFGAESYDTQRISLGLVYTIPVF